MSTVLNDRDAILQAATVRIVNPKNAWINLQASAPGFHLNAAGQVDLGVVTVTADLVGLDDDVTFSAVGATLSNAAGRKVDVTYGGQTAIVTATVTSNGDEFKRSLIIPVLRDGASGTGTPGARGAGHYYAYGTAWTDVLANITVPTAKVVGDVVTISGGTFVMEKRWTGSEWVENGVVINGNLIVPGSILSSAVNTRGMNILDENGNITFAANSSLSEQTATNPNLLERIDLWTNEGGAWTYVNTDLSAANAKNGIHKVFPGNQFCLFRSRSFALNQNTDYTLSFRTTNDGAGGARGVTCDLYPDDLPEQFVLVQVGAQSYEVHWRTGTQASLANCMVRIFSGDTGNASQLLIHDVKLERGKVKTAWNDVVLDARTINNYVAPGAIGNTQIGGDLFSTNWNGYTDARGAGWLMQRSGALYCFTLRARGAISGGDYSSDYVWVEGDRPDGSKKRGFMLNESGLLLGNPSRGGYFQITAEGDMHTPNITSIQGKTTINGDVTINGALLVNTKLQNPSISTAFSISVPDIDSLNNPTTQDAFAGTTFYPSNGVGPYTCTWVFTPSPFLSMTSAPGNPNVVIKCSRSTGWHYGYLSVTVKDEGTGATDTASCNVRFQMGSGAEP